MKNFILFVMILFFSSAMAYAAEKIPVKITPAEVYSTETDSIEIGDILDFKVVQDVYYDNKLYAKKNSMVTAYVEYVNENGWAGEHSFIRLSNLKLYGTNNKVIPLDKNIVLSGKNYYKKKNTKTGKFIHNITFWARGDELYLEPKRDTINVFFIIR